MAWLGRTISKEEHENFKPFGIYRPWGSHSWKNHDIKVEMREFQWHYSEYDDRNKMYDEVYTRTSCIALFFNEPGIPMEKMEEAFRHAVHSSKLSEYDDKEYVDKRINIERLAGGGCVFTWTKDNINPEYICYEGIREITWRVQNLLEIYFPDEFKTEEDEDEEDEDEE